MQKKEPIGVDATRELVEYTAESAIAVAVDQAIQSNMRLYESLPGNGKKVLLGLVTCRIKGRLEEFLKTRTIIDTSETTYIQKLETITTEDLFALGKEVFGDEAVKEAEKAANSND